MSKLKMATVSAVATALVLLLVLSVVWVALKVMDGLGRTELWSDCEYDATLSGVQGWCVVISRYPETPAHSQRTQLEIAAMRDGAPDSYRLVVAYPFYDSRAGDELDVDFSRVGEQIVVTDPHTGSSITYTHEQYARQR